MATLEQQRLTEVVGGRVLLLVGSSTPVSGLAGSIAGFCRDGIEVRLRSLGAGALSQAVKAVALARTMLTDASKGVTKELSVIPMFETVIIDGNERSAIVLAIVVTPCI